MMRFNGNSKKGVLCRALSIVLSFACIVSVFSMPISAKADTLKDLENQYKQLEQKQKELAKQYDETVDKLEEKMKYQGALEEQISSAIQQLDVLMFRIEVLDEEIERLEQEAEIKQTEINNTSDQYKDRIRAIYMAGDTGMLEFVLNSESLGDFFDRVVMAKYISDHDNGIIDELKADKQELNEKILKVEENRADLSNTKVELEAKKDELDSLHNKNNSVIAELSQNEEFALAQQKKNNERLNELNREIQAAYKELENQNNTNNGSGGSSNNPVIDDKVYPSGFQWPVPGFHTITSGFRTKSRPNHNGIDIAGRGAYGANIVAAMDGTVYKVGDHGSVSYGKFVMIDHGYINGKRYITLYAHCSSISVKKGQSVKQGQKIANVGSTGDSTGPHLHYEVRANGSYTNPTKYY